MTRPHACGLCSSPYNSLSWWGRWMMMMMVPHAALGSGTKCAPKS